MGIKSGSSFGNKPIILELHDSTNRVYDRLITKAMRHLTCYVESSPHPTNRALDVMYEMKVMGPVRMNQKFNFYLPHWRRAELD